MIYNLKTGIGLDINSDLDVVLKVGESEVTLTSDLAHDLGYQLDYLASSADRSWGNPARKNPTKNSFSGE